MENKTKFKCYDGNSGPNYAKEIWSYEKAALFMRQHQKVNVKRLLVSGYTDLFNGVENCDVEPIKSLGFFAPPRAY